MKNTHGGTQIRKQTVLNVKSWWRLALYGRFYFYNDYFMSVAVRRQYNYEKYILGPTLRGNLAANINRRQ